MGQTTVMLPGLKKIYRRFVKNPAIDRAVHGVMERYADARSRLANFAFPKKFNWDWKLEMLSGAYERDTAALFRRIIAPGMHVVDIGAHVGYFTRLFSRLVGPSGRVSAFEADPENYALLERNCRGLANVRLSAEAVADHDGTIDFFETVNNTGCHSVVASAARPTKLTVPAVTLDEWLERTAGPRVDVIKMDIEGGEPIALRGMARTIQENPTIALVIELCPTNLRDGGVAPGSFLAELHRLGLRTFAITASGLKEITPEQASRGEFHIKPDYHYVNVYAARAPAA